MKHLKNNICFRVLGSPKLLIQDIFKVNPETSKDVDAVGDDELKKYEMQRDVMGLSKIER